MYVCVCVRLFSLRFSMWWLKISILWGVTPCNQVSATSDIKSHRAASVISINELLYWLIWPVLLKCQYISTRLHGVTSQGCFLHLYFVIYHCSNVVHCVWNACNFPYCLQMAGHPDCLLHNDDLICSSYKSMSLIFWAFALVWFCL